MIKALILDEADPEHGNAGVRVSGDPSAIAAQTIALIHTIYRGMLESKNYVAALAFGLTLINSALNGDMWSMDSSTVKLFAKVDE